MSRDFMATVQGRDFRHSQNRDRITRGIPPPPIVDGIYRNRSPSSLFFSTVRMDSVLGTPMPATPLPPGGFYSDQSTDNNGNILILIKPDNYLGLLIQSVGRQVSNSNIGTPPGRNELRPDLIIDDSGNPAWYKMKIRAWGIAPLCNPFGPPVSSTVPTGPVGSGTTGVVYDASYRFNFRWPDFASSIDNITGASVKQIALNSVLSGTEPKGLWEIDRIITCYGKYNAAQWLMGSPGIDIQTPSNVYQIFRFFFDGALTFQIPNSSWQEPNYLLRNPVSPFSVRNVPATDNGSTVLGSVYTPEFVHYATAMCAYPLSLQKVNAPGPIEIQNLKLSFVSKIRA